MTNSDGTSYGKGGNKYDKGRNKYDSGMIRPRVYRGCVLVYQIKIGCICKML